MPMITVGWRRLPLQWARPALYDAIADGRPHNGFATWQLLAGNLYTLGFDYMRAALLARGEP